MMIMQTSVVGSTLSPLRQIVYSGGCVNIRPFETGALSVGRNGSGLKVKQVYTNFLDCRCKTGRRCPRFEIFLRRL
jgi:hypothetical protein